MTPSLSRPFRRTLGRAILPLAVGAFAPACRHAGPSETRPVASLAGSRSAQEAFHPIRRAFVAGDARDRALLEGRIEWFIVAFPDDALVPLAKVYLALIAVDQGNLERAERLVRQVQAGPSGNTRDLAELAEGSIWYARNEPALALDHFLPLVGKLIDPYARILLDQRMVAAAIAAKSWYEAIAYMDLWLRDSQEDELNGSRLQVRKSLEQIPSDVLERMLKTMQDEHAGAGYGGEIKKALVARLAVVALEKQDTGLARRLMESSGSTPALGEAAEGLEELASSGGAPTIEGRTVGLLMSTGTAERAAEVAERAADVLTGAVVVLRPAAGGAPPAHGGADAAASVRLLTRDERDPKRTELAMTALASQGAAVIIAGFEPDQAQVAAAFSRRTGVPVLLLAPLANPGTEPPTAYLLGAAAEEEALPVAEALARRGARSVAPVGADAPSDPFRQFAVAKPAPCDAPIQKAGEARFPVEAWRKAKVDALLLLGDSFCAADALEEAESEGLGRAWAVLGLDAGDLAAEPSRFPLLVTRAGPFPLLRTEPNSPLRGFRRRYGKAPSWFAALGHDAAVLAKAALQALPADRVSDGKEVDRRHQLASAAIAGAVGELWSTDASGFAGKNTLRREITVVEVK